MADARPPKSFLLSSELAEYLVAHGTPPDVVQEALIEETAALGAVAGMQIAPEQGAFLTVFTRLIGARRAIEIGTFTGYSALCIARGLPDDGRLICCDVSEEWTALGVKAWESSRRRSIASTSASRRRSTRSPRCPPARPSISRSSTPTSRTTRTTSTRSLPLMRTNGAILVDNVLWDGRVDPRPMPTTRTPIAIRAFNDKVANDDRVDTVMLPVADGLTICRKR